MSPALTMQVQQHLIGHRYKEAISLLDQQLQINPNNTDALFKKAEIYIDLGQYKNAEAVLNQIKILKPNDEKLNRFSLIVEKYRATEPKNEIGFDQDEAYVSDLKHYWTYSSLHYYRLSGDGKWGGRINYSARYGTHAEQYQLEAYPRLTTNLNGAFTLAYSNTSQRLFPTIAYTLEGYYSYHPNFEFSLGQYGQRFVRFSNRQIFTYTGSVGYYYGQYFIWFRPSVYTPTSTEGNEIGITRYFENSANVANFITLRVSSGLLPDIGNLPPLDNIIKVHQDTIGVSGQYAVTKTVFLKGRLSYYHQNYPNNLLREITDGDVGVVVQY